MVKFEDLEIWDTVKGYENYKVSSKGRVYSAKSKKFLKPWMHKQGYHFVGLCKDNKKKNHLIHGLVASTFYFIEDYDGYEIDHIDRDKTNNNLLNLRFCSRSENNLNKSLSTRNNSGLKGVSYFKRDNKWTAHININQKQKNLGLFDTKEEAYEAYKEASKKYHGEYGYAP
jgi:hypothetical protein